MAIWMVRAGSNGEWEDVALNQGVAVIHWADMPNLSNVRSREQMEALCQEVYPDEEPNKIRNWVGQLWAFRERIQPDDLIVLPLKTRSAIAIGRVTGPYKYRSDLSEDTRHTRPVEWLRTDLPRSAFDQDLLYSMGAFMTVCQIQRNNAEERIRALLKGGRSEPPVTPPEPPPTDLETYARDMIRTYVGQKFRGRDLERLVMAVLRALGYQTQLAPTGADGGVDIIAGQGPMGFDPPRLCVQVKSGDQPQDVKTLRELHGVLKTFGAQQGLLVAWGGFKTTVVEEARRLFFEIRLWDADNLVDALLETYDRLPAELRTELPLKRIWTLALEEE